MSQAGGPAFREAARFWTWLGFVNFGGPTGQIAIMHRELVERRGWIDEESFLHALSFCMLLPGPEAQQLAIYIGWRLHAVRGGLVAGITFVLPAAVAIAALAWVAAAHGDVTWVAAIFDGLSAAVVGIVAAAAIAIGRRAVRGPVAAWTALAAFLAIWLVGVPFPVVIGGAALAGLAAGRARLGLPPDEATRERPASPPFGRTVRVAIACVLVWWVPILLVVALAGPSSLFGRLGVFFSQASLVTFGGAYAVLAYVGREVVARFGLTSADVVAGLGLAETTPGPLILVVEYLAFQAAYRTPGTLAPGVAGLAATAIALWATFAPCFLWVFVGAPYVERLRANPRLRAALGGVTAGVLGVIASLALTFATAVVFTQTHVVHPLTADVLLPRLDSLHPGHAILAAAAFVAVWRFKVHVAWVVVAAALAGLAGSALR
jgi:chromate transporter